MADRLPAPGPRLLLNAQAFGFGPAAAAAVLAEELALLGCVPDYVGEGHTLDLQRTPPYRAIHDWTDLSEGERLARLRRRAPHYDLFVTAMDFPAATLARRAGLDVAVYDALTWFWPEIPAVAHDTALYLAQDFFGVRERLAADPALRSRALVVPPLIPPRRTWRPGRHVLVNLGGLHNPYWQTSDAVAYARLMLEAVRAAQPVARPVVATASRRVAAELADPAVGTYDHADVLDLMGSAAYACMTPGLGHIYDAAATGVPTLWLPSVNETHPAQARQLAAHGYCDAHLDWADLGQAIDSAAPTPDFLAAVGAAVRRTSATPALRDLLTARIAKSTAGLGPAPGRARALTDRFGHGGTRRAAAALVRHAAARGLRGRGRTDD
ncbi:hypothetical protein ACFWBX_20055 [Streptomyces sp. NPDC059991]|uniref:hypothetical protein n=1 Tax=Streptomyces sp. NPDC059991 TaxID=3347028 RepID=UPI0036748DC6